MLGMSLHRQVWGLLPVKGRCSSASSALLCTPRVRGPCTSPARSWWDKHWLASLPWRQACSVEAAGAAHCVKQQQLSGKVAGFDQVTAILGLLKRHLSRQQSDVERSRLPQRARGDQKVSEGRSQSTTLCAGRCSPSSAPSHQGLHALAAALLGSEHTVGVLRAKRCSSG